MNRITRTAVRFLKFAMLSVVLSLGVSAQALEIISVNQINGDGSGNNVGVNNTAEAGEFAGAPGYNEDYWNDVVQNTTYNGTLVDSAGFTVSGLSVTLGAGGGNINWSLTAWSPGNPGNDFQMMWGNLASPVSVSGIPFATYDLVVYSMKDQILQGPQSDSVTLTIDGTTTTVNQSWPQSSVSPTNFITYDVTGNPGGTLNAGNANTIIFKGLTASSISFDSNGNGFQIAQASTTPPPSGMVIVVR